MGENIEDLVLPESTGDKKTKQKGLYVILGLVILLLIFGVILANMIFGSASDDSNSTANALKTEQAKVIDDKIPENSDAKKADNVDMDLKPLDETDTGDKKMEVVKADDEELMKPAKEDKEDKIVDDTVAPVAKPTPKPKPKHVVHHKPKPHPKPHPKPKHVATYGGSGNVYIQVGSFSKGPSESFINKIRRSGFKYRIKEVNGFRRVLVGPFRNKSEANSVLSTVRGRISQSAFVK